MFGVRHMMSVFAVVLLVSNAATAARVLVVPGAEDAAVRTAVATVAVAEVGTAAATAELIEAASASGLVCTAVDVACWHRLGTLGGYDSVILVTDNAVIVHGAAAVEAPRLQPGTAGIASAVRRAFGQRGAIDVVAVPASAVVSIDGVAVVGVADDIVPGRHVVDVHAEGFAPATVTVDLVGGAVVHENVALVAEAAASSSPLFVASLVTLGVGGVVAAAGVATGAYGELTTTGGCYRDSHGGCDLSRTGWLVAMGGGAVVVVGAILFGVAQ